MQIAGIESMGINELNFEIQRGGKFVIFHYCISIVIMTFKRPSKIYFIRAGESAVSKGLPFTALSLVLGWWGIPWGPIYTISSLVTNFRGGKDITQEMVQALNQSR